MRKIFVSLVLILLVSFPVFGENFLDNFNEKFQSFNDNFYSGELITGKQSIQVTYYCGNGIKENTEICERKQDCGLNKMCVSTAVPIGSCNKCEERSPEAYTLMNCLFDFEDQAETCSSSSNFVNGVKNCKVRTYSCIQNCGNDLQCIANCKSLSQNCILNLGASTSCLKQRERDECISRVLTPTQPPVTLTRYRCSGTSCILAGPNDLGPYFISSSCDNRCAAPPPNVDPYQQCLTDCNINLPNLLTSCQNSCPPTGIRTYATDFFARATSTISFGRITPPRPPGPSCRDNCQNIYGTNYCSNYCSSLYGSRPPGNICGNKRKEAPEICDYYEGCPAGKTCANNLEVLGRTYFNNDCTRCVNDPNYVPPPLPPPPPPTCTPNWDCTAWNDCAPDNKQIRTCRDLNNCNVNTGKPEESKSCVYVAACTPNWDCTEFGQCALNNQQTRTCTDSNSCGTSTGKPAETQACTYVPPCNPSWSCTNWNQCALNNQQTRTCTDSNNCNVNTGKPEESQTCTYVAPPPTCNPSWSCTNWNQCALNNQQTRTCTDSNNCNVNTGKPEESQTCTYVPPCNPSWSCTAWNDCSQGGSQTRACNDINNCNVNTGKPEETKSCVYVAACTPNWDCTAFGQCASNNQQTRTCSDSNNCGVNEGKPAESQQCEYIPPCNPSWSCTAWNDCSQEGIQTKTCTDSNSCGVNTGKPEESQTCTPPVIPRGGDDLLSCIRSCWSEYKSCVSSNSCDSKGNFDEEQQCKEDCDLPRDQCKEGCRNQFK